VIPKKGDQCHRDRCHRADFADNNDDDDDDDDDDAIDWKRDLRAVKMASAKAAETFSEKQLRQLDADNEQFEAATQTTRRGVDVPDSLQIVPITFDELRKSQNNAEKV